MESKSKIGFLGSLGSYSHQAASFLRPEFSAVGFNSFEELVSATESGKVAEAVLPLENSASGRIPDVHRLVVSMELFIVREYLLDVNHCLAVVGPCDENEIHTIYSHPQGFIQSSRFLAERFPDAAHKTKSDTATAIKEMTEANDRGIAAIGSVFAADLYSAMVLHKKISNRDDNITRFVLLSPTANLNSKNNMTSMILQVKHTPGSLVSALAVFGAHGVNITKLETYMISEATNLPTFYLDIGCGSQDEKLVAAMHEIRQHVTFSKFLGSYVADTTRSGTNGFLRP